MWGIVNMTEQEFYRILEDTREGREYLDLVSSCTSRSLVSEPGFEIHHIFITSLGGKNVQENKVKLTVFEHCRAHALLAKAIPCYKTLQPIVMMSNGQVQKLEDLEKVTLEEQLEWSRLREKALHQPKPRESVEKMKATLTGRTISAEVRSHMGGAGRGKKFINNGVVHKRVLPEEVDKWLAQGWVLGRTKEVKQRIGERCKGRVSSGKGKVYVTGPDDKELKILPEQIQKYLDMGYRLGRCSSFSFRRSQYLKGNIFTKGRKKVYNSEGIEKVIPEDQLSEYLSKGWLLGTSERHLQKIREAKNGRR